MRRREDESLGLFGALAMIAIALAVVTVISMIAVEFITAPVAFFLLAGLALLALSYAGIVGVFQHLPENTSFEERETLSPDLEPDIAIQRRSHRINVQVISPPAHRYPYIHHECVEPPSPFYRERFFCPRNRSHHHHFMDQTPPPHYHRFRNPGLDPRQYFWTPS